MVIGIVFGCLSALAIIIAIGVIFGKVTQKLFNKKGYIGGFWLGFFFSAIGFIYAAALPDLILRKNLEHNTKIIKKIEENLNSIIEEMPISNELQATIKKQAEDVEIVADIDEEIIEIPELDMSRVPKNLPVTKKCCPHCYSVINMVEINCPVCGKRTIPYSK